MNSMDYLNQISADNRQAAAKPGSLLDGLPIPKNILKWLGIAVGVVFLLIIVAAIIPSGGGTSGERQLIEQVNVRSTNLMQTISDYNPQVKSSRLRAIANNISSVLNANQSQTQSVIIENYADEKGKYATTASVADSETSYIGQVNNELEYARISATLDPSYRRILVREVGYLINIENKLLNNTKKSTLTSYIPQSINNLTQLQAELQNFTDPTF